MLKLCYCMALLVTFCSRYDHTLMTDVITNYYIYIHRVFISIQKKIFTLKTLKKKKKIITIIKKHLTVSNGFQTCPVTNPLCNLTGPNSFTLYGVSNPIKSPWQAWNCTLIIVYTFFSRLTISVFIAYIIIHRISETIFILAHVYFLSRAKRVYHWAYDDNNNSNSNIEGKQAHVALPLDNT